MTPDLFRASPKPTNLISVQTCVNSDIFVGCKFIHSLSNDSKIIHGDVKKLRLPATKSQGNLAIRSSRFSVHIIIVVTVALEVGCHGAA